MVVLFTFTGKGMSYSSQQKYFYMKFLYSFLIGVVMLLLPSSSFANDFETELNESDANFIGHVLDKKSKEHISFISVALKGTTIKTVTDETGHFFFRNLPEGTFTVEVSGLGYKTIQHKLTFVKGKTVEYNFEVDEENITLSGVVISANRNETARKFAPTLVNVLSMQTFETTNSTNLSQGLNFQPGVRVETNCQNCGFQQVRINGLDGPYTQILIDSRPIFSSLAGVYGLEQIPANMIDRVEVMRGGGSALFGSSAVAGTINIITKEPLRNSGSFSHTFTGVGDFGGFDNNTTLNASLVTDDHKMGLAVFGQTRSRQGFDYDGDGYTELPKLENTVVGLRSYLRTSNYTKLSLEYHRIHEFRRGGDSINLQPYRANIAEQLEHDINTGSVKFDYFSPNGKHRLGVFASLQDVDRASYYGSGMDLNADGMTKDLTWVTGAQYNYHFDNCLFLPADLTLGLEYNQDEMEDKQFGYNRHMKQTVRIASGFFQNEWKNEMWSFLVGGRLDKHNMLDKVVFSPRLNVRYNPIEDINLRASYSYGFRAPQAFDEDLHIEAVGGSASLIELAHGLKQENSQSVSVSADMYHQWGDWQGNLLVEGFFTDIDDVFALSKKGERDGVIIWERGNEKGAHVYGGTLEGKIAWRDKLQLQAGFTFQKAEYEEARAWSDEGNVKPEKRMFRTPDTYGYFTLTYNPIKPLTLALSGTYTGSMLVAHNAGYIAENTTVETPKFMDMGLKVGYDFKIYKHINLGVNLGVSNIFDSYQDDFDRGSLRDSGYIYGPAMPRSYYASVKISY